ncbi:MAG: TolC family protein [Zetaproteobacteria bacterium CG12_big_fil_rev_8_21_14_0_65_55_1124]|nr:MAG: transporter [Zetaproteobacteria bacterium CG1_02_55_237]PIS19432.1 MAG: TolC family protein [Zetaproteobacteria bacterium CG08_land_8_20_14_0_20_55_17]PIW43002.1 MAG: TolC family protein [Zetaproteobacteria bacterium CG12_big_fil_rev_8_21_14_0_65_55_1124]PIY51543.1 MAG: TolC family protein [Zetaproteobacteria bacterium CG_4_10_14_0_8_um_filter_55_43]PIZ39230.1 MAG: TolC family protein [Zetaproteobacteria bacterium CG_4_10_14_0_2_um_filter_55_20]PJB80155.1 MAG: TolC family protein [Zeta
MIRFPYIPLCLTLLCFSAQADAQELSLSNVVQAVLQQNPNLSLSRTDTAIAAADEQRVQGLLDTSINGSISGSDEQIPVASDFQAAENRILQINGGISQPLSNGDTLGIQASYSRSGQAFTSPLAAQLARFNPAYRSQIDVTYRHALLRGADRPDYSLGLESVQAKTEAASLSEYIVARTLALSALNAFFRLASDDINVTIARQAVERARQVLRYQKYRQEFGLIEQAEALQAEALLAARQTDLQRAHAARQMDASALSRLMLRKTGQNISLTLPPLSASASTPDIDAAEKTALVQRPDVRAVDARLKAAEADLAAAQDIDSTQLDVVAQLGTRSLDGKPAPAAAQGFSVNDRFASLSLEMQDSLGRNSAKAAIRKAELARQRLSDQRQQSLEQIRDDLSAAINAIDTGIPSLRMARLQAIAEQKKYQSELSRYREGRSNTATVVQFEGELRNAELQERLQQLTLQLAHYQLAWAQGSLLKDLGIELHEGAGQP